MQSLSLSKTHQRIREKHPETAFLVVLFIVLHISAFGLIGSTILAMMDIGYQWIAWIQPLFILTPTATLTFLAVKWRVFSKGWWNRGLGWITHRDMRTAESIFVCTFVFLLLVSVTLCVFALSYFVVSLSRV